MPKIGPVTKEQAAAIARKAANMAAQQVKQQPKSKKSGSNKRKQQRVGSPGGRGGLGALVSYINPFSQHAWKVPDEFSAKSVAYRSRSFITPTTVTSSGGTHQLIAMQFLSALKGQSSTAPVFTGGNAFPLTSWGTKANIPDYDSLFGTAGSETFVNFNRYRIVSWGVVLKNLGPPVSAGGGVYLIEASNLVSGGTVPEPFTYNVNAPRKEVIPMTAFSKGVIWISRPYDPRSRTFQIGNVSSNTDSCFWTQLYVFCPDADLSVSMQAEVFMNLELLPTTGTFIDRMATEAAPDAPAFRAACEKVVAKLPLFFEDVRDPRTGGYLEQAMKELGVVVGSGVLAGSTMLLKHMAKQRDPITGDPNPFAWV